MPRAATRGGRKPSPPPAPRRRCISCERTFPLTAEHFYRCLERWQSVCKRCSIRRARQWTEANPERAFRNRRSLRARYGTARRSATRRGLPWSIDFDLYARLVMNPCAYCGGPLPQVGSGLDRLDNSKGYEFGNVVTCCATCNTVRSDIFRPDLMQVLGAVIKYARKRDPEGLYERHAKHTPKATRRQRARAKSAINN